MKKILGTVAIAAVVALAASPVMAGAQLSDMIDNTGAQLTTLPIYINYVSYIIGIALAIAGIAKLKAHADNPGQTSMKDGLARLFAATAFISLPFILTMLRDSTSTTSGTASFQSLQALTP